MARRSKGNGALKFTPPCLATAVKVPPAGERWLHEIKFDGYRVQALFENGRARILTRTGLDWTDRFAGIAKAAEGLGTSSAVIDGEAVVLDDGGIARFSLLQDDLSKGDFGRVKLMAFDLLHLEGESIAGTPLLERKARLNRLLSRVDNGRLRFVDHIAGHGAEAFARSCAMGLEGIVSKRGDRPYRSGRHGDWTKAKCVRSDPFIVVGFTLQNGSDASVGALLLAYFADGRLAYAGRVGTGFSHRETIALAEGLAAIRTVEPAFAATISRQQRTGVVWVEPKLVAQIAWRDVTADGMLRHAVFERFRTDIAAGDVGRPQVMP